MDCPRDSYCFSPTKRIGFTPVNPQANSLVEVFQKVLVKLVHTSITENKDPGRLFKHICELTGLHHIELRV